MQSKALIYCHNNRKDLARSIEASLAAYRQMNVPVKMYNSDLYTVISSDDGTILARFGYRDYEHGISHSAISEEAIEIFKV